MPYQVSGQAIDFTFPSEQAFEAAEHWYNSTSKPEIIAFCRARGADLFVATNDPYYPSGVKLTPDWELIAMELYASRA